MSSRNKDLIDYLLLYGAYIDIDDCDSTLYFTEKKRKINIQEYITNFKSKRRKLYHKE